MNRQRAAAGARQGALAVALALALVACGGDDDTGDDASSTTAGDVATSSPTTAGDVATSPTTSPATSATTSPVVDTTAGEATATSAATGSTAPAGEGVAFSGPEGDYTVVFPTPPDTSTQEAPTGAGDTVELLIHQATDGDVGFGVSELDLPLGAPYDLEAGRDGTVAAVGGTLEASAPTSLGGRDGIEFVASLQSSGVAGTYVGRIYADARRVWQLVVAAPGTFDATAPEVAEFFDSFQFTEDG